MITAALCLLAVGSADIVRRFVPARRRVIAYVAGALVLLVYSAGVSAFPAALVAAFVTAGWVWAMPMTGAGRAGLWPVAALAALAVALGVWWGAGGWPLLDP